jgi:hypothetical protein
MKPAIWVPAFFALAGAVYGQQLISAESGLLNHIEGNALLNGYQIMVKPGDFPQMKEGDGFRTEKGRQEVLLGPGVFLRLGENSAFRMVSARLTDTRIDFERGSALIECTSLPRHGHLAVTFRQATLSILKDGVYRLDSDPVRLKVYAGEARVLQGGRKRLGEAVCWYLTACRFPGISVSRRETRFTSGRESARNSLRRRASRRRSTFIRPGFRMPPTPGFGLPRSGFTRLFFSMEPGRMPGDFGITAQPTPRRRLPRWILSQRSSNGATPRPSRAGKPIPA